MPARSRTTKRPIAKKAKKLRKASHEDLLMTIRDVKRIPWGGGKEIGLSKRQRKPAEMEMNRRYRAHRQDVSHFHPEHYSYGELEVIAKGRGCEAWNFAMRRFDVPKAAREMARAELARRDARRK